MELIKSHYERILSEDPVVRILLDRSTKDLGFKEVSETIFRSWYKEQYLPLARGEDVDMNLVLVRAKLSWLLHGWRVAPGRVYQITKTLALMLLHTKLDIDSRFFKVPHKRSLIELPEGVLTDYYDRDIRSIYVLYYSNREEYTNLYKGLPGQGFGIESTIDAEDGVLSIQFIMRSKYGADSPLGLDVGLRKGESIQSCMESCLDFTMQNAKGLASQMKLLDKSLKLSYNASGFTDKDYAVYRSVFQLVLNTVLYVTSSDADVQETLGRSKSLEKKIRQERDPRKKAALESRLKERPKEPYFVVGSSLKFTQSETQAYDDLNSHSHKVRYPVGGHWRLQWVGPRESCCQKPTWVRPHFRGPEFAEIIRKTAILTE